jgi:hypothetical protein
VDMKAELEKFSFNNKNPANARASALRTLAEINGLIGRHAMAPERAADTPVSELNRDELVLELARLRARCLDRDLSGA